MKLDPIFTVKENKLYKIQDNSIIDSDALKSFKSIEIKWSTIEMEDETYNEEYLAKLREELKFLEPSETYAILIPVVDKPLETPEQYELFINAYNHTARRVKDATSVAGFLLPSELLKNGISENSPAAEFIETLEKKHAQYVYFATKENENIAQQAQETVVIL